jgi:hypothetical protein
MLKSLLATSLILGGLSLPVFANAGVGSGPIKCESVKVGSMTNTSCTRFQTKTRVPKTAPTKLSLPKQKPACKIKVDQTTGTVSGSGSCLAEGQLK